ncbi:hypothetical protein A9Q84_19265 [Halobacteriovorax marinus]|uniref:Uncharacterized protein n=1 Tax=Halobacteriovorax marinus TaxID=97084 RepID=A0A1Y5F8W9_9BACT|nr:hypothetical protein A9Q84_19265 [Halobacteriovorax marinus]
MNSKIEFILFSLASILLVGGYVYFAEFNKTLMYNIPNGTYNIKRIACPEDLDLDNPLITREKDKDDFELTFSLSLDFDNIVKRSLIINNHEGKIVLESKDCQSAAHFRISKNTDYSTLFDFKNVDIQTKGRCKFKKTYKGKEYHINKYGHFAISQNFFSSYWYDEYIPTVEWSPRRIGNRIILEAKFKNLLDIPCPKQNKVSWEIEKIVDQS